MQNDAILNDPAGSTVKLGKQWFNFTDATDTSVKENSTSWDWVQGGAAGGFGGNLYGTFASGANPVVSANITLNGHERISARGGEYWNLVQPYQHHECIPATGINVYSFGLKPEEHQPSGTCNMSRIDNAILNLTLTANAVSGGAKVKVYAVNYNVLRILSGMGGFKFPIINRCNIVFMLLEICSVTYAEPKNSQPQVFGYLVENSVVHPTAPPTHADDMPMPAVSPGYHNLGNTSKLREVPESLWYQTTMETWWWRTSEVRHGKNPKDWVIRSQAPKPVTDKGMEKVQRLNGCGSEKSSQLLKGIRYSPASLETWRAVAEGRTATKCIWRRSLHCCNFNHQQLSVHGASAMSRYSNIHFSLRVTKTPLFEYTQD